MSIKNTSLLKKNFVKRSDLKVKGVYRINTSFRPYRARSYGYKNIPSNILLVGSIGKGGIEPRIPSRGRTPSKIYSKFSRNISLKDILKQRVQKKYQNLVLKGMYPIFEDGKRIWYEFFFQDPYV